MDYSNIIKIAEETDKKRVQKYLDTKRWTILAVAPGTREDGSAYAMYSLGWWGPHDPEFPENDHTEFPV